MTAFKQHHNSNTVQESSDNESSDNERGRDQRFYNGYPPALRKCFDEQERAFSQAGSWQPNGRYPWQRQLRRSLFLSLTSQHQNLQVGFRWEDWVSRTTVRCPKINFFCGLCYEKPVRTSFAELFWIWIFMFSVLGPQDPNTSTQQRPAPQS